MEYYIKTKDLEEATELEYGVEPNDYHFHKGKVYIIEKIRIVEPNEGVIYLFSVEDKRVENRR